MVSGVQRSESVSEACRRIGELVAVNPDTLRGWVNRDGIERGERVGVPAEVNARIKELERDNAELRRANEFLRTASAFMQSPRLCRRWWSGRVFGLVRAGG